MAIGLLESDINLQDSSQRIQISDIIIKGNQKLTQQKYDSAISLYSYADSIAKLFDDFSNSSVCNHNIGLCYSRKGKYVLAREYFENSILLCDENSNELRKAHYQISLGVLFKKMGMFEHSMQIIMNSISIAESYENEELLATSLNAVAGIQNTFGNYEDAISYYYQVENIFKSSNNLKGLSVVYNNMGNVFLNMDSLSLSKSFYRESINIKRILNGENSIVSPYKNIGDLCLKLNQSDSAMSYYLKAYENSKIIGNISKTIMVLVALVDISIQNNDFKSATNYVSEISRLDRRNIGEDLHLDYLKSFKEYYKAIDKYEKALLYSEKYIDKSDEIFNFEKTRGLNELRFQYEAEKKDKKIIYLNQLDRIKSKSLRIKNRGLVFMSSGIISIIALLIFVILAYRRSQTDKKKIQLLMRENRHRTQNNLQLLSSVLSIQADQVKEEHREEVMAAEFRVQSIVLLNQLLEYKEESDRVSLELYIQSIAEGLIDAYTIGNQVKLEVNISKIKVPASKMTHIGLILNELMTNALKYAFDGISKPIISITCLERVDEQYQLSISDNGVGLQKGWEERSNSSMGINLVKDLSDQLNGHFIIENRKGSYFELIFNI